MEARIFVVEIDDEPYLEVTSSTTEGLLLIQIPEAAAAAVRYLDGDCDYGLLVTMADEVFIHNGV
jgi:hypothetical protein